VTFTGALANSINAVFARIANEYVGAQNLDQMAKNFGFGDSYEGFSLPVRASSLGDLPPEQWTQGLIAQMAFGQGPVTTNPFEMALVAATVANDGTMMEPRLVREVRSPDGVIIDKPTSRVRKHALDEETAKTLGDMMQHVVTDVESSAAIPGVKVAGKTGSAEAPGDELHSWFIAFAPADDPQIAVAVIVENGQEAYKAAIPIARRLMETYLKRSGKLPVQPPSTQSAQPKNESTQSVQPKNETTQPAQPKNQSPQPTQSQSESPFQIPFQNPAQAPSQNPGQSPGG
jgi:peptidoglycan glycosyltransferase